MAAELVMLLATEEGSVLAAIDEAGELSLENSSWESRRGLLD